MLRLRLLLLEEIDDEVLIVFYEVIRKAFTSQVITKVLSPFGIESLEGHKLAPVSVAPR